VEGPAISPENSKRIASILASLFAADKALFKSSIPMTELLVCVKKSKELKELSIPLSTISELKLIVRIECSFTLGFPSLNRETIPKNKKIKNRKENPARIKAKNILNTDFIRFYFYTIIVKINDFK